MHAATPPALKLHSATNRRTPGRARKDAALQASHGLTTASRPWRAQAGVTEQRSLHLAGERSANDQTARKMHQLVCKASGHASTVRRRLRPGKARCQLSKRDRQSTACVIRDGARPTCGGRRRCQGLLTHDLLPYPAPAATPRLQLLFHRAAITAERSRPNP